MIKHLPLIVVLCFLTSHPLFADETHSQHSDHAELSELVDVSELNNPPQVSIEATRDSMAGWNIKVDTRQSRFAPEQVNHEHIAGEGHAHLYVDGKKSLVFMVHGFICRRLTKGNTSYVLHLTPTITRPILYTEKRSRQRLKS